MESVLSSVYGMTKRILAPGIIGLVALAALALASRMLQPPVPAPKDAWIPKNAVVLDSAQVPGSQKAFVFQYDLGALGSSVPMVSIDQPSHLPGFLLLTGSPTHVWWTTPDTLMVEVSSDGNELSPPPKGIVVIPTRAQKPAR